MERQRDMSRRWHAVPIQRSVIYRCCVTVFLSIVWVWTDLTFHIPLCVKRPKNLADTSVHRMSSEQVYFRRPSIILPCVRNAINASTFFGDILWYVRPEVLNHNIMLAKVPNCCGKRVMLGLHLASTPCNGNHPELVHRTVCRPLILHLCNLVFRLPHFTFFCFCRLMSTGGCCHHILRYSADGEKRMSLGEEKGTWVTTRSHRETDDLLKLIGTWSLNLIWTWKPALRHQYKCKI